MFYHTSFSDNLKTQNREKRSIDSRLGHNEIVEKFENLIDFIYITIDVDDRQEEPRLILQHLQKKLQDDRPLLHEMIHLFPDKEQKVHYLYSIKVIFESLRALNDFAGTGKENEKTEKEKNKIKFLNSAANLKTTLLSFYQDILSKPKPNQKDGDDFLMLCEKYFQVLLYCSYFILYFV